MNNTQLTAVPLNVGAPETGAPRLGQVHILQAKSLTTKPAEMGEEPPPDPGVHRLKAARRQLGRGCHTWWSCAEPYCGSVCGPNAFQRKRNYRTANI